MTIAIRPLDEAGCEEDAADFGVLGNAARLRHDGTTGNSCMADMRELPVVQSAAHAFERFRQAVERFFDKLKIAKCAATRYD